MTAKPALQKRPNRLLHIAKETRVRQEDSSRQIKKEKGKLNNREMGVIRRNRHLSMLILNVNGLNALMKRHRIANLEKKTTICCLQKSNLTEKNKHWLRVKVWKKIFKQAGVAIFISNKVDFRLKSIQRDTSY
jgi:hypothetical protein